MTGGLLKGTGARHCEGRAIGSGGQEGVDNLGLAGVASTGGGGRVKSREAILHGGGAWTEAAREDQSAMHRTRHRKPR